VRKRVGVSVQSTGEGEGRHVCLEGWKRRGLEAVMAAAAAAVGAGLGVIGGHQRSRFIAGTAAPPPPRHSPNLLPEDALEQHVAQAARQVLSHEGKRPHLRGRRRGAMRSQDACRQLPIFERQEAGAGKIQRHRMHPAPITARTKTCPMLKVTPLLGGAQGWL